MLTPELLKEIDERRSQEDMKVLLAHAHATVGEVVCIECPTESELAAQVAELEAKVAELEAALAGAPDDDPGPEPDGEAPTEPGDGEA